MYAAERQQAIVEQVTRGARLSVAALARQYDVTSETVRRDLSALERAGLLRRVHGGAVPPSAVSALVPRYDGDLADTDERDRIARHALSLLPGQSGTVLLDSGATTARLAMMLPRDRQLTVVTNAVGIAARLAGCASIALHLLPGRVLPGTHAAVGEDTVEALSRLRTDVAFVCADGVSLRHGLSTRDHAEAATKRAIVAGAQRVVVLADSSALGQEHVVRFADLEQVDVVVTDAGVGLAEREALIDLDIEVLVA